MNIACLTFTKSGEEIARKLQGMKEHKVNTFTKEDYGDSLNKIFKEYDGIVFISSTGIAVRICAPFLEHKTKDPAIVVIDDLCRYSISLISGHIGGANNLAQEIGEYLKCTPIITTASDGRGIEAVDMFAKNNNLYIEDFNDAKLITAMMIEGKKIKLKADRDLSLNYNKLVHEDEEGIIFVTSKEKVESHKPYCMLRPKTLNVGIGCRRGKSKDDILELINKVLKENNLSLNSIKAIATVDIKNDEEGIIELCKKLQVEMKVFSRVEIAQIEHKFKKSNFVKERIGVSSVCEPCAYLAGGNLIVEKQAQNGITIAISEEA